MTTLDELEGSIIAGKYRLERLIGRGGFSAVFRGEHVAMDRKIAVKVLDPRSGHYVDEDATWTQRFEREARVISRLSHSSTITVYDYGIEHGLHYIIMEFVEGRSLHQELKAYGAMAPARAARIASEILGSLEEAHHVGILHRDLKPANIMLTHDFKGDEHVKVLDFGIAKLMSRSNVRDDNHTEEDRFVGTPRYAAPEQLLAQQVTPATDIYGVGALLWEMIMGEPLIKSSVWGECVTVHLEGGLLELPTSSGAPAGLKLIVDRAISRHPDDRFSSCAEMLADLESWASSGFKHGETMRPGSSNVSGDTGGMRFPDAAVGVEPTMDAPRGTMDSIVRRAAEPHPDSSLEEVSANLYDGRYSFDPNLDDGASGWLGQAASEPAPPLSTSLKTPARTFPETPRAKRNTRPASPTPEQTPSNLDFSNVELSTEFATDLPSADDQDSISASRRPRPVGPPIGREPLPGTPIRSSSPSGSFDMTRLVIGVVIVGALLALGLWFFLGQRAPNEPALDLDAEDVATLDSIDDTLRDLEDKTEIKRIASAFEQARPSAFSNKGILRVVSSVGFDHQGDIPAPKTKGHGIHDAYLFGGKQGTLEVYIFESTNPDAVLQYKYNARPEQRLVTMDTYKIVKLSPRGIMKKSRIETIASKLMKYRDLVKDRSTGEGK